MNQNIVENRQVSATMEKEIGKNIFLVAPGVWRMKDVFVNGRVEVDKLSNWYFNESHGANFTGLKSRIAGRVPTLICK